MDGLLPHLGLIVSGGNTLLFTLDAGRRITTLAATRDDAAGEALDKGAKLLGLGLSRRAADRAAGCDPAGRMHSISRGGSAGGTNWISVSPG